MADKAKMMVAHGHLEEMLDLPEGVWIATITRIPSTSERGEWSFDLELRSTEDDAFPAERIEGVYSRSDDGMIALMEFIAPETVAAS